MVAPRKETLSADHAEADQYAFRQRGVKRLRPSVSAVRNPELAQFVHGLALT
jgi:hypothetical protein